MGVPAVICAASVSLELIDSWRKSKRNKNKDQKNHVWCSYKLYFPTFCPDVLQKGKPSTLGRRHALCFTGFFTVNSNKLTALARFWRSWLDFLKSQTSLLPERSQQFSTFVPLESFPYPVRFYKTRTFCPLYLFSLPVLFSIVHLPSGLVTFRCQEMGLLRIFPCGRDSGKIPFISTSLWLSPVFPVYRNTSVLSNGGNNFLAMISQSRHHSVASVIWYFVSSSQTSSA